EVVNYKSEFRAFVLDGQVLDCAVYEGNGSVKLAVSFINSMVRNINVPHATVIDAGLSDEGFSLIEFNASWGAGLNGCQATKILPAIIAASGGESFT
ncbi:MAG: ATP-grasp domain-containing protein, partial [Candidatus Competibacterales bacterium]